MRKMLVEDLGRVLMKTGALRFGTFTLTSGKLSSYYVDLRIIPSIHGIMQKTVEAFVSVIENSVGVSSFDAIGGIPTAGLALASPVAYTLKKPLVYFRKEPRNHGTGKRVEGFLPPGSRVLVLDDLVTTGMSIMAAAEAFRGEGGVVNDCVVLIDRLEGGEKELAKNGIKVHRLTEIMEVTNLLYEMEAISSDEKEAIERQVSLQSSDYE